MDVSITAWDGKRNWDSVRAITAVRWLMRNKTIQAWGGPLQGLVLHPRGGLDPVQPPPTPPRPLASSPVTITFSLAAAEVLTAFTGRGKLRDDRHHPGRQLQGRTRTATHPWVPAKPITLKWTNFR